MSLLLLQLSLFAAVVIKLTSSQSTYDVTYQDSDVTGCGSSGQIEQLVKAVSQLQRDVAELKNASSPSPTGGVKGKYGEVVKQPIRPSMAAFIASVERRYFTFTLLLRPTGR